MLYVVYSVKLCCVCFRMLFAHLCKVSVDAFSSTVVRCLYDWCMRAYVCVRLFVFCKFVYGTCMLLYVLCRIGVRLMYECCTIVYVLCMKCAGILYDFVYELCTMRYVVLNVCVF